VDCLKKVVRDNELRDRFASAAARRAATEFSMERNVNRTEDLYTALLSEAV
jgi:glycosyltransferase involved in cell wall biosynthesis